MAKASIVEMVWRKFVKKKNGDALIEASGIKKDDQRKKDKHNDESQKQIKTTKCVWTMPNFRLRVKSMFANDVDRDTITSF